ncbi:hemerythrin domain-containing protein [Kibdelosporangium philippinense]|uniref:Hemerythrin domain-containing protein n=1 Tax=Kibdelosporangium philippinense TaxID=211113 RepID=A0ABS8ZIG7_9PSEU|nr:hemerythrin domain-containing protein [Kibdelosporangium philippinense]MCE7006243.1 hemerythrin domain-containing protein [Kibdelosporangium philippinense]
MNSTSRITAFGTQLVEVHDWLREQLALLRADVDAGTAQPRKLQAHCVAFCSALTKHHTGEDGGAFPELAKQFPELKPVLAQLTQDHDMITMLLNSLETLDFTNKQEAQRELNGIEAIMESHFAYEERKIVEALNAMENPSWDGKFLSKG